MNTQIPYNLPIEILAYLDEQDLINALYSALEEV